MKFQFKKILIDLKVSNLNRAIRFYRDILGLSLIHQAKSWASFKAQGAEIHLYLYGGAKKWLEFSVSKIEKEVEKLKKKGVRFFIEKKEIDLQKITGEIMQFHWGKMACFKDSEGNQLALVEEKF